jgi:hypothetical protein
MSVSIVAGGTAQRPTTIESRASWAVALTALGVYSVLVRRADDHRRRAEANRRRTRWSAVGSSSGLFAGLVRVGARRHRDGMPCRTHRRAVGRHAWRADDRGGACSRDSWRPGHAMDRPWCVDRAPRRCRDQRAALRLCHPLVRPTARDRGGPDFRPVNISPAPSGRPCSSARLLLSAGAKRCWSMRCSRSR